MLEFFYSIFSQNPQWAVFFISMCPLLESKVGIPFGLTKEIWGEATLSPFICFVFSLLGSLLPCIFIILLFKKIKQHTSIWIVSKFQSKYKDTFEKIATKQTAFKKCLLLASFVAVPLPLTGVYTGSVIAGLTNLKIWQGFLSIAIGELISCLMILILCMFFETSTLYILIVSLIICALCLLISILTSLFKAKKRKEM